MNEKQTYTKVKTPIMWLVIGDNNSGNNFTPVYNIPKT